MLRNQKIIQQFATSTPNRFMGMTEAGIPALVSQFLGFNGSLNLPASFGGGKVRTRVQPQHLTLGPTNNGSFAFANWFSEQDSSEMILALITGVKADGSGSFSGLCCGAFRRDGAADAVLVGASQTLFLQEDVAGACTIEVATVGGNQLNINFTAGEDVIATCSIISVRV